MIKKNIPNIITGFNMFSGCIAVILALSGYTFYASLFIALSAVFDFCDGFSARLLKAYSDMGKELDSLADLISFGFAPAAIAYNILSVNTATDINSLVALDTASFILLLPLVMVVFSGFRLAKFNVDTRQTSSFIGLPTPANALFWASLPVIEQAAENQALIVVINNVYFVVISLIVLSLLLVAEIPMFSFKMKSLAFKGNAVRYFFLISFITAMIIFGLSGLMFLIPLYILFSVLNKYMK